MPRIRQPTSLLPAPTTPPARPRADEVNKKPAAVGLVSPYGSCLELDLELDDVEVDAQLATVAREVDLLVGALAAQ